MRVADKLTPEPIMSCFHNQGKSQMLATPRVKQKAENMLELTGRKQRNWRCLRSLVLSLFNTDKNKKAKIYIPRVIYMAQMKAGQALDKSRNFVKPTIYIPPSCLHGADESQTNTQQIKGLWQDNDLHTLSCLHGTDKSQISTRQVKAQIKAIQTLDLSRNCPTTDERTRPL